MGWFARQVELMEREPKDVDLDFEGDLPMKGVTVDGNEYEILGDPFGGYRVYAIELTDTQEIYDCVFRGSLNECKNYVFWNMEVDF